MKIVRRLPVPLTISLCLLASACGKSSEPASDATDDTSASGATAGAVGGALSGSNASGTLALLSPAPSNRFKDFFRFLPEAFAAPSCPTFKSTGTTCVGSGSTIWLTYQNCSFGGPATWSGVQALIGSTGTATCGSFPLPSSGQTLTRQFVTTAGGTTPGTMTRTNAFGTDVKIDHASANLNNFDTGTTISTLANGGYGAQVTFGTLGKRNSIVVRERVYTSAFDHSIDGTITITETSSISTTQTITGTFTVYHNKLQVVGTTTFTNLTHDDSCCLPTAGTFKTSFAAGSHVSPTTAGSALVGKTETLQFTGCGTATLTKTDGSTSKISLNCL